MQIKHSSLLLCIVLFLSMYMSCTAKTVEQAKEPVDYVNPYIGNISHLLVPTYPTVHLPNSMLRVYPERHDYTGNKLNGLPVVVTSHRGNSAFAIYPLSGDKRAQSKTAAMEYDNEVIKPYYYATYLNQENIDAEFTPSNQSAIYRFSFGKGTDKGSIVLTSQRGEFSIEDNAISGYQQIGDFDSKVYVYVIANLKPTKKEYLNADKSSVELSFSNASTSPLELRYGISFISIEQAKKNLEREVKNISFDEQKQRGRNTWNTTLGKIKVDGDCEDSKTVFYTSLYRTYERMICLSEDGKYYSAIDHKIHNDNGSPFYTDDWLWDTYRATHPLRVIIEPKMEVDMINSFLRMAEQSDNFWMPTFPEVTGDSRRMNSNHGVATIIDAYSKGLTNFDLAAAYDASKKGITEKTLIPWSGEKAGVLDDFYKENGYFPALQTNETEYVETVNSFERRQPVAVTLGTVYDEWCLSQIAKQLGKHDDHAYFLARSLNYRKLFNHDTKFFHPKDKNGKFVEPFDYRYSGGQGAREYYGENNGWIYRWDVPHNIKDLVSLMGGKEAFVAELERMYDEPLGKSKFDFYAQMPDHTGNVGQFSMANEPSLHIPYLYNYAGQPWRTQKRIRTLLDQWFRNDLMGVPGDEDGGGMTAFVVFSQLGFYPITPGLPIYVIGSPTFKNASISLDGGKTFEIACQNYSPKNKYIQSAKLNGVNWDKSWFSHSELMQGGKLELVMGEKPNMQWASSESALPPSFELNN